jgi:hypothetical protein
MKDSIRTVRLLLRCWDLEDAPLLKEAIDSSLCELQMWVPYSLTSIEVDRTALLAANLHPPLGRLHSDVSRMADASTGAPIVRSVVVAHSVNFHSSLESCSRRTSRAQSKESLSLDWTSRR